LDSKNALKGGIMKAFKFIALIATSLILFTGCNQKEANAAELSTKDSWSDTIQTMEVNLVETKTEETTPVFQKDEQIEYETYLSLVDKDTLDPEIPLVEETTIKYVLQLACVTDRDRLLGEQEKLRNQGYETTISKRFSNGIAYYRLRLNGEYSHAEAKELGKEIVQKFLNIKDYLVLRKS
jgi:cell division septation protein DedD